MINSTLFNSNIREIILNMGTVSTDARGYKLGLEVGIAEDIEYNYVQTVDALAHKIELYRSTGVKF